jgi:hypothetical protein
MFRESKGLPELRQTSAGVKKAGAGAAIIAVRAFRACRFFGLFLSSAAKQIPLDLKTSCR